MGMMARMRSLAPAFILSVGVLFVLFMVISDSNVLEALGGRTNNVGSINGEDISYQEFVDMVDRQREVQQTQTGKDIEEEEIGQLREQVWEAVVTQKLIEEEIEKFGLTVSDDEIREVILGPNPPDFIKQNFIDSAGNFNRQLYESSLYDPQNKNALIQAEELVRNTLLNEKLQSLILASVTVSEAEIKRKYSDQNISMNVEYSLAELALFPDSAVSVSDDDLKDYFNEHPDDYQVPAQRKLKYVLFTNQPSGEDSATVKKILENVVKDLRTDTSDFKYYVDIYSTEPYTKDTLIISALSPAVAKEIYAAEEGSIIGPVPAYEGYAVYNIVNILPSNDVYANASHILVNQFGSDSINYAEAMKIYSRLSAGEDFAKLAREKSADPGSAASGGDLGWFGKGAMVPEFEKAVFQGKVGEIQKPVKTSFGYHIIKVTGKSDKKYIVEKIVNPVKQSAATADETYQRADEFSYIAGKNGFQKEAELVSYSVQESPPFTEEAFGVPGLGQNKRIINFAFENDLNDVSDVFRIPNGYVVVQVSEIINEGVKPFDEVKDLVKTNVVREKKYEKSKQLLTELRSKIKQIKDIPQLNSKIKVDTTGMFSGSTGNIPTVGRDFAFLEKAMKLDLKKISDPFKGGRGYYLMNVLERTKFDSSDYNIKRNMIRDQLLQEKKQMYVSQWVTKLRADADIEDNRYMFFGQ